MITRINGLVNDVIAHHFDSLCFIIFRKRRSGKPYEIAITCKKKEVNELKIRKNISVYTQCIIKSSISFGKVFTEVYAEKLSLKEFEQNPDYVKLARQKKQDPSGDDSDIFAVSEDEDDR